MLKNIDALFDEGIEVIDIDIKLLKSYKNHNYPIYSEDKVKGLVQSILKYGIIQPVIVRTLDDGFYEILAGHNRTEGARRAGLEKVPCIVTFGLSDDEAQEYVDDTNVYQRSINELPTSVRADIIAEYYYRNKKQGRRIDLLESDSDSAYKTIEGEAVLGAEESVKNEYMLSASEIARSLRISKLPKGYKEWLDDGQISRRVAVDLSFVDPSILDVVYTYISFTKEKISNTHSKALRALNYVPSDLELHKLFNPPKEDEELYINLEAGLKKRLGHKVKVKQKSLTINYADRTELVMLLKQLKLDDVVDFLSSGEEV